MYTMTKLKKRTLNRRCKRNTNTRKNTNRYLTRTSRRSSQLSHLLIHQHRHQATIHKLRTRFLRCTKRMKLTKRILNRVWQPRLPNLRL